MERIYLMSFFNKKKGVAELTESTLTELFDFIDTKDFYFCKFVEWWAKKNLKNYTKNFELNDVQTVEMLKEYFSIRNVEFKILN